ncbi:MAG: PmoA family protein [Chitinophagaceae bacterium]
MKNSILFLLSQLVLIAAFSQTKTVTFVQSAQKVDVLIDGKQFTSFMYPDTLEKPVLYPIRAANGSMVTRGFPLAPRDGERTDHPHHIGLWFNYENVNGLDFWNNSYNIPAANKIRYGWIRNTKILAVQKGKTSGSLSYSANWENQGKQILLKEQTSFVFTGTDNSRTIDRITTLTAQKDTVFFKDIKDGLLGIRVATALEMPSDKEAEFIDSKGNRTKHAATGNGANGSYLTSAGKKGNEAWGTRGNWCILSAVKDAQPISIAIIDHPKNPGYPTYWHARDYGLFAANPLGQNIFSNGKEQLNLTLAPGQSVTFRFRVLITSGKDVSTSDLDQQAAIFAQWQ